MLRISLRGNSPKVYPRRDARRSIITETEIHIFVLYWINSFLKSFFLAVKANTSISAHAIIDLLSSVGIPKYYGRFEHVAEVKDDQISFFNSIWRNN